MVNAKGTVAALSSPLKAASPLSLVSSLLVTSRVKEVFTLLCTPGEVFTVYILPTTLFCSDFAQNISSWDKVDICI